MKPLTEQDHYEALDLPRGAGPQEVERAYALALSTYSEDSLAGYPVFEPGDVELLRERIELAYQTLSDPESRRAYDAGLDPSLAPPAEDDLAIAPAAEAEPAPREELIDSLEMVDDEEGEWTGARLRRARLSQGVEIDQIAETTKINPTYLEFIEEERFDELPAAVYVRGFVVGVAGVLGLDAKAVAATYMERFEAKRGGGRRRLFSRR